MHWFSGWGGRAEKAECSFFLELSTIIFVDQFCPRIYDILAAYLASNGTSDS